MPHVESNNITYLQFYDMPNSVNNSDSGVNNSGILNNINNLHCKDILHNYGILYTFLPLTRDTLNL